MTAALRPPWLTARPIAHRGLHDRGAGNVVENSPSAARAAIARGFAIECDVQITKDGEAVVFHDFDLDRLTAAHGRVDALDAIAVQALVLRGTDDPILSLDDFLAQVDGRVPVVVEIKSRFDGDLRLAERTARCAGAYAGPVCLESFDPFVIAHLRRDRARLGIAHVPLGMVAQANYGDPADEWAHLDPGHKYALAQFLFFDITRPDFLSWSVKDLPHAIPNLCRAGLGMPVTTWTVRTPEQREIAKAWADQIVFEGVAE